MIKMLPSEIKIDNPYVMCRFDCSNCTENEYGGCDERIAFQEGVLKTLSQVVEVDIDDLYQKYHDYIETEKIAMIHQLYDHELKPFSQFLQEKMNTKQIPNVIKGKPFTVKFL